MIPPGMTKSEANDLLQRIKSEGSHYCRVRGKGVKGRQHYVKTAWQFLCTNPKVLQDYLTQGDEWYYLLPGSTEPVGPVPRSELLQLKLEEVSVFGSNFTEWRKASEVFALKVNLSGKEESIGDSIVGLSKVLAETEMPETVKPEDFKPAALLEGEAPVIADPHTVQLEANFAETETVRGGM